MGDQDLISFLSFWADAGVDCAFEESPQIRISPPSPPERRAAPAPALEVDIAPRLRGSTAAEELSSAIEAAQRLASEASDLDALNTAIAAFDRCPLKTQGASRAVFSRGRPSAPIVLIGEAPGAEEDKSGLPFVGRAGQLLDRMLAAAGLEDAVFILNTVFWRPPGNRTPTPEEQAVCLPFVERAIALIEPQLIILCGAASAKALLRSKEGVMSLRGRWMEWTSSDGAIALPALATLHPAFLLRQPQEKEKAWTDLLMVTRRLSENARS